MWTQRDTDPGTVPAIADRDNVSGEANGQTMVTPAPGAGDAGNVNAPSVGTSDDPTTEIEPYEPPEPDAIQLLQIAITSAQNRLDMAESPGEVIRTGRFYMGDQDALAAAVARARSVLDRSGITDTEAMAATYELSQAVQTFFDSVIDPYNRYRPFLEHIAYGEDNPPKRELRAAWIATVLNIDWPSVDARGTTPAHVDRQRAELRQRFDELYALGFNSVIFQISPTGDAFYPSEVSPWSAWLTGETNFQGRLIDSSGNEFSPMGYAVELARERNMELRAWFNPYRITHTIGPYTWGNGIILSSTGQRVTSLAEIREEWSGIPGTAFYLFGDYVKLGENRYVVDPGAPGVRDWIVSRVIEVVRNYDIDVVHFDDYFYPSDYVDTQTFNRHNTLENNWATNQVFPDTPDGRNAWRRENTEMMVRDVQAALRAEAPWVKFGISPGGVWKSSPGGNTGFDGGGFDAGTGSTSTTTWSNYHSSWADTRRWVIENFIDYLTPQIYWDWAHNTAPYGNIAEWWGRLFHDFGPDGHLRNSQGEYTNAQLFIGIGLYRMDEDNLVHKWNNLHEWEGQRTMLRQLAYVTGNPSISGSMTFTQNQMRPQAGSGFIRNGMWPTMQTLSTTLWRYPALVPPMPHLGGVAPAAPVNVSVSGNVISWDNTETSTSQLVMPRYFVIYRSQSANVDINNPANIVAIVPAANGQVSYEWTLNGDLAGYRFAVTAVNRLHDESLPGRQ